MTKLDERILQIEAEAEAEGPEAVAEYHQLRTRFRLARELLQQIANVPGPTTNQWLVERGQPEGEERPCWYSHYAHPERSLWTTDAWRASMFPTREAAEEWIVEHELEARAVSHGFMSRLDPQEIAREALNLG